MIHYWAVIYYTWLYICTGVRGIDSGVCYLHFEYIYSFFFWVGIVVYKMGMFLPGDHRFLPRDVTSHIAIKDREPEQGHSNSSSS